MSALSIRMLPKGIAMALRDAVRKTGKTKTEIVLQALAKALGVTPHRERRARVRQFFGHMQRSDYAAFRKATRHFSHIDESEWDCPQPQAEGTRAPVK
ncbi:MAG: hypothetical protein HY696_10550 [Deltaproteobacteria bacterium]|nr:hypothetical protein [Deltaproteobacteria bacterium]